ncbi:MAG: hypothetical protein ABIB71_07155 [Candidatus Woesearchaeota archaeon]
MNKKAVAILLIAAVGFLVAAVAFYSFGYKSLPGGESSYYVGSSSMRVFHAYNLGESRLLYIDLAAKRSFDKALAAGDNSEFSRIFSSEFGNYLDAFNLEYGYDLLASDFELNVDNSGIKGICSRRLNVTVGNVEYYFRPNFRVEGAFGFKAEAELPV